MFIRNILYQPKFKFAVLGSGPSSFYITQRLLNNIKNDNIKIDMFEQLPIPFGLVRYGVAPDHPDVKNCTNSFTKLSTDSRFEFFGNVHINNGDLNNDNFNNDTLNIRLSELSKHYTHLILSYGASKPLTLNIDTKSKNNVYTASDFVNWYNGHPYYFKDLHERIDNDLRTSKKVAIIGQGNVGLDIGRMLINKDLNKLSTTDIPSKVLDSLKSSTVNHVDLIGRRSLKEVAFTAKETREMMNLENVFYKPLMKENQVEDVIKFNDEHDNSKEWRAKKRILSLIKDGSKHKEQGGGYSWSLKFLKSPVAYIHDETNERLKSIKFSVNELINVDGKPAAKISDKTVEEDYDIVIESIGYKSLPISDIPFDKKRNVIKNVNGRVVDDENNVIQNVYSTGWASRGPVGVIAQTMYDSYSVADTIINDLNNISNDQHNYSNVNYDWKPSLENPKVDTPSQIRDHAVKWNDWQKINEHEIELGKQNNKLREKLLTTDDTLNCIN